MAKPGQNSGKKIPTIEMIIDLTRFIMGVLAGLSFEQVQNLLENKNTILRKKLLEVFEVIVEVDPFAEVREEWRQFYIRHFGFSGPTNFSKVLIPPKPSTGSWRLIIIQEGCTLNEVITAMRNKFKVWVYNEDLDASVTMNTRTSDTSYAVWVQTGVDSDEKYLGYSTRVVDPGGSIGVTLLERLVLELKHFEETGCHLNVNGTTLCTGSREKPIHVPTVCSNSSTAEVYVSINTVDFWSGDCGLREAVSL